ncbi:MAG: DUF4389 domain-containing protein [Candidatus Diapherotrites archaeon]|nr:DUF4389 domain-containing protein [Candidatus Diapherotrites archaeon]
MQTIDFQVKEQEKASRVELLVRLVYWIPLIIVSAILGIIGGIAFIVNVLSILFLGKKFLSISRFVAMSIGYRAKMTAYLMCSTDERPPIIPEELR